MLGHCGGGRLPIGCSESIPGGSGGKVEALD